LSFTLLATVSVQKFGGTTKIGRHRSHRFLKKSVKNGENRENSAKTHRRRRRNSETGSTDKLAGLADKSTDFQKTGVAISGRFMSKIDKWNEKTVKNNNMTSTKFVYANSP
jgi:gas vesicle protein